MARDRTVHITGANRVIGRAVADAFASDGISVVAVVRTDAAGKSVVDALNADRAIEVGVQRDASDLTWLFMQPVKDCGIDDDIVRTKDCVETPGSRTTKICTPEDRLVRLRSEGARFSEHF